MPLGGRLFFVTHLPPSLNKRRYGGQLRSAATLGSKICAKRRRRLSTGSHGWPCVISTPVLRQPLQLRQDQRRLPRQRLQLRQDQRRLPRLFEQKLRLCALVLPGASRHHSATLRDAFAVSATSLGEKAISTAATRENIRDQQVPLRGKIRKAQSAYMFSASPSKAAIGLCCLNSSKQQFRRSKITSIRVEERVHAHRSVAPTSAMITSAMPAT
jgi:hypothetical protein